MREDSSCLQTADTVIATDYDDSITAMSLLCFGSRRRKEEEEVFFPFFRGPSLGAMGIHCTDLTAQV